MTSSCIVHFRFIAAAALAVFAGSTAALADDAVAKKAFEDGKAAFAHRSANSTKALEDGVKLLEAAEGQAQDKLLKYDILILESRMLYFQGTHAPNDAAKKAIHLKGRAKADAAEAVSSEFSEAPFFAGIHLARWGEANGIVSSVSQVPTLKKYMQAAIDRTTRDDAEGESVDGYGPYRTLGRVYKKLPGFLGGSTAESIKYLDKAVKGAPTLALNVLYLADTLVKDGNDAQKAEGRRLLTELLAKDPNTLDPNRVPETIEEFAAARLVLAGKDIP